MTTREMEWKAKKLTLTAAEGMLHERQQDAEAREYKAQIIEHHNEDYILQTFVKKAATTKVNHRPSGGLRRMDSRNIFMVIVDNILFFGLAVFNACVQVIERCLALLMPAPAAREIGVLATLMACLLLAFAAVGEAPTIYSSVSQHIHSTHVLSGIRALL